MNRLSAETALSPAAEKLLEIFLVAAGNEQHNIDWLKENFSSAAGSALEVASGENNSGITADQLLQWIELRFETDTQQYGSGSCSCDSSDSTYESKARLVAYLKEGNPWNLRERELGAIPEVRSGRVRNKRLQTVSTSLGKMTPGGRSFTWTTRNSLKSNLKPPNS